MNLEEVATEVLASGLNEEVQFIKRKIQLSEGQRRAEYEEFDAEKRRLATRIRSVRRDLREQLTARPSKYVDIELLKRSGKPLKELKAYLGKSPEDVEQILDLQCIDLRKRLDLLNYEISKKKSRLDGCLKEMKELKTGNEMETILLLPSTTDSEVTKLENKIHETGLHLHEMRHMERKYSRMRQSLLDDRVFFQSTLDNYQGEIAKQAKEIQHLKSVRDEAVRLRDKTRRKLARLEARVLKQGLEREGQLAQLKKKVEEGRQQLERVERSLVPSGGKTLHQQDSGDLEVGLSTEILAKEALIEKLARLKELTGAKDEEDIMGKLRGQKSTKERLLRLKESIENEKKKVELKREQLEAELEAVKFAEVKDKEQNEEEVEILEKEISQIEEKIQEETMMLDRETAELKELQRFISYLVHLLKVLAGEESPKSTFKIEENLTILTEELKRRFNEMVPLINIQPDQNQNEKDEINDLFIKELEALEVSSRRGVATGEPEKPTDETPDVPSRDFLKRQSQVIVESQGKRKSNYPKETQPQSYR